jgi:phosphonate transport system permease protein
MKLFQYQEVATLAIAILFLVVLVDVVGQVVRTRILDTRAVTCGPLIED